MLRFEATDNPGLSFFYFLFLIKVLINCFDQTGGKNLTISNSFKFAEIRRQQPEAFRSSFDLVIYYSVILSMFILSQDWPECYLLGIVVAY